MKLKKWIINFFYFILYRNDLHDDDPKGLKDSKRFLLQRCKRFLNQGSKKYLIKLVQGIINEVYLFRML